MKYISDDSCCYIRFVKKLVKDQRCVIGFYFCDPFNDRSYSPAIRILYRIECENVFVDSIFHYFSRPINRVNSDIMLLFILFFIRRRGKRVYIPRTIEEKMDLKPIFSSDDYIYFVTGDNKYAVFFKI